MTLFYACLGLIVVLIVTNLLTGVSLHRARRFRAVPLLTPSQDLHRSEGPSGLVFQSEAGSGFGDRVGYYLGACALGRCWGMDIYAQWVNPEAHDMGTAPLELVSYPARLHFDQPIPYREMAYWAAIPNFRELRFNGHRWGPGYDLVPDLQYAMWCCWSRNFREQISRERYLEAWLEEARELRPAFDIHAPGEPFMVLHLRRGDKSHPNVPLVDQETRRVLGECLNHHRTWVICSDCKTTAAEFEAFITSGGAKVLAFPPEPLKTKSMLIEFFWITRASGVVQSVGQAGNYGGFSSFSYLPAAIAEIPLITCIPREKVGDTRFQDYARVNKRRLKNIYYNQEVEAFLRQVGTGR
jgi:hypothetical protein